MAYRPTVNFDQLTLYIGSCATGSCIASSTALTSVVFAELPGQTTRTVFTPADVGMPIAIVGGGPVNPLMPTPWYVQGSTFVTTIAAYVSPSEVTLTDAPDTSFFNTGFNNIILFNPCVLSSDQSIATPAFQFNSSIAPGTRDTCQFSVICQDSAYLARFGVIVNGQPIYVTSESDELGISFGGYIDTLSVLSYPGVLGIFAYQATCVSWAGLATRRIVPPALGTTLSGAGDTVFAEVVLRFLKDDGVAVSAASAPNITLPCAVGQFVNQLLDQIVQLISTPDSSWYWYTDEWRTFILAQRTATAAPWDVTDGSDLFAGSTPYQQQFQTTHNQLANFVFGLGTKVLLNALNCTFAGDGSSRTFNTPQPVGQTPTITLNNASQTVGIQGVDTGFDWYWSEGSTTITQDMNGTILQSTDALVVAYQLETPGVAQSPNSASLQTQQAIEGTSGEYDYSFTVSVPIDPVNLLDLATGYQINYGTPAQTVTFYTLRPGLKTGQLQGITLADAGISGTFLIATVSVTVTNNVLVWQYTAFGGANIGDSITGLVQFINRGGPQAGITQPVPVIAVGFHEITIDHTKVSGGDKTNFVLYFGGVYEWLTGPPGGTVVYPDGSDIYFSSDSEGNDILDFDLEFFDFSTGQIAAWVRIPTLSHTVDTVIYIQYGNTAQDVSLANPAGTWSPTTEVSGTPNNNYRAVYHLEETTGPYVDQTQYGNASTGSLGAGYPTRVTGPFAYAQSFPVAPATFEGITVPNAIAGDGFSNYSASLECWMQMPSGAGGGTNFQDAFDAQVTSGFGYGLAIAVRDHLPIGVINVNGGRTTDAGPTAVDDGFWHYLVVTMDASNSYLYMDGVLAATIGVGQNEAMTGTNPIQLSGNRGGLGWSTWGGYLAECKITQVALDADTIKTNYANQSSPNTFYALGATSSGTVGQTTNVTGNASGTVTHSSGALTANDPIFGNGGGDIKVGTKTGNTDQAQMASGSAGSTGAPLLYDASGNAVAGVTGQLVPSGGLTGNILAKNSGTSYDTHWITNTSGVHSEPLTDGNSNFIFAAGDIVVVVDVPN